jgi:hypothetical protein
VAAVGPSTGEEEGREEVEDQAAVGRVGEEAAEACWCYERGEVQEEVVVERPGEALGEVLVLLVEEEQAEGTNEPVAAAAAGNHGYRREPEVEGYRHEPEAEVGRVAVDHGLVAAEAEQLLLLVVAEVVSFVLSQLPCPRAPR